MTERNDAPQRLVVGPWSHVGMRGDATYCHEVDFGPQSVWGVQRYFEEQLAFFDRWLPDDATGQPEGEAPVRIFVMGGGSGRRTAEGKLDHGGQWRDEWEWPLARRVETPYYLHGDGVLSTSPPSAGDAPRQFTFDPAHPVPTLGGLYCSIGELPAEGAGMEQAWARFLSPVLRLRDLLTPGPVDQKESPAFFGSEEPYPRLSERPDVLVFQTEPLTEPVEVTGPMKVHLWVSSSALDTDFTAKLVDVHPANEDYPEGYDMLLNDSVIRCRFREGFDREVLLEPGVVGAGHDHAAADEQPVRRRPPDPRRHLVVELAAPRREPEHGRADRPAHASGRRRAGRLRRRRASVPHRPAGDPASEP